MKLKPGTYEYIKRAVADMFEDYGIHEIPLDPFKLANKIGISIIPYSSLDEEEKAQALRYSPDGFSLETVDNKWLIYYNDDSLDIPRIYQTIMHEIGHYILGHTSEGPVEEAEAKFFAKYALAPTPLIQTLIEEKSVGQLVVERSADRAFQTFIDDDLDNAAGRVLSIARDSVPSVASEIDGERLPDLRLPVSHFEPVEDFVAGVRDLEARRLEPFPRDGKENLVRFLLFLLLFRFLFLFLFLFRLDFRRFRKVVQPAARTNSRDASTAENEQN